MIKIGVIGTGIIGNTHLDTIKASDIAKLAAVVDVNEEKAREAGEKFGVPFYTDYKCISESMDAVILNLPHFLHCEVSCYFLEKGINVLVEKPMAMSAFECDKMIQAAKQGGAKLAVGHVQRFFGSNEIVRNFYKNETYGKLCMTNERRNIYYFSDSRPKWFLSKKLSGGGIVMNYGAHALDKLAYILESDPVSVEANVGNLLEGYDVEGHAQIYMTFANGVSSVMTFGGYHGFDVNETTYYFEKAAVRVHDSNKIEIAENGKFENYEFKEESQPFNKQLVEFVNYIEGRESKIATAEYSKKIIETIEKIYACSGANRKER